MAYKLNPQITNTILRNLELGASHTMAANAAGINRGTLHKWIMIGKNAKSGKYFEFAKEVARAEAQAGLLCLELLQTKIQEGNLKAIFWFLERKFNYRRDNQLMIAEDLLPQKEEKQISFDTILHVQAKELREAMASAAKKESWQAYAALQRQLLSVLIQIRSMEAEQGGIDTMSNLTDMQLMDEITNIICNLPPMARQRIIDDLQIMTNNNVIPIKK